MGYESALHTQMLAKHCAICGKPLCDPDSVERGTGPECALKLGIVDPVRGVDLAMVERALEIGAPKFRQAVSRYLPDDPRKAVSVGVWHAAMAADYGGDGSVETIAGAQMLALGCGYVVLAERMAKWQSRDISMTKDGRVIVFDTPYEPSFVAAIKSVPGRRFDPGKKAWSVPEDRMIEGVNALVAAFPGRLAKGLDGTLFSIPDKPVPIPPPETKPAPGPKYETGEVAARPKALGDIKPGDIVRDPEGIEREVGWVGAKNGSEPRVGVRVPGVRGYTFYSFSDVRYAKEKDVEALEKDLVKEQQADARLVGVEVAALPPVRARKIPETFFSYQVEGARWLDRARSGLLADEQGLGKTAQAAVVIDPPCLIVCPATLRTNWAREIGRWNPDLSTQIVSGKTAVDPKSLTADVVIVNYDILSAHMEALEQKRWKTLVADEVQYAKTLKWMKDKATGQFEYSGSARAVALAKLGKKSDRRILLTGTPIMNRTAELWPLLHVLDPREWDNFFKFGVRYCAGVKNKYGWDFSGTSNVDELHRRISGHYMLRRLKNEVMKDLPEKSRRSIEVALSAGKAREYERASKEFLKWVAANGGTEAVERTLRAQTLAKMTVLRRIAAEGKVEAALEWIVDYHESTGRPLVVMAHHHTVLEPIVEELKKAGLRVGTIVGGDSQASRQKSIDAFQSGGLDVICCSILAAGVGLTLTAAEEMLFIERAWRPADLVQAEDRIHRIGQKNSVQITYLDGYNTIDGAISGLLMEKVSTSASVIDGVDLSEEEASARVFGALFSMLHANASSRSGGADGALYPAFNWIDPGDM